MKNLQQTAEAANAAKSRLSIMNTSQKNKILRAMADALNDNAASILDSNAEDIEKAVNNGISEALIDRLRLTEERIASMVAGIEDVINLPDPIGEVIYGVKRPNGLEITQKRTPLGVIGIIYEARPNVTADAVALCVKSGNCVILKGGKEAINSNIAIAGIMREAGEKFGLPKGAVGIVEDTSRESARSMMKMNGLIDVLIPRGGAGLIKSVVENSTVPIIETGTGNCHIYVDNSADIDSAVKIIVNAKTSRPSVCNAAESLVIHKDIAYDLLPVLFDKLKSKGVEIRGCAIAQGFGALPASEEDYGREFLDYIISVKVVNSFDEAVKHINKYSTGHSEAIITENYTNARRFQEEIDSAAVYVNASTRFTDGFEFGFGAEIGISTQKLHARGPMGLNALTTAKFIIDGNGQIRE